MLHKNSHAIFAQYTKLTIEILRKMLYSISIPQLTNNLFSFPPFKTNILNGTPGRELFSVFFYLLFTGKQKILVGDRAYHLGYFSDRTAERLMQELRQYIEE